MTITSFYFLCFICVGALLYYLVQERFQWMVLLAMSVAYYTLSQSVLALIYPALTVLTVYLCALKIAGTDNKGIKKLMLWTGCLVSLALLIFVKYIPKSLFGITEECAGPLGGIFALVPLGISFYTFSLLGYLFDVYYEMGEADKNIAKVATFGMLFPNMTSGPIMRYTDIKESLFGGHRFTYEGFTKGCQRILWGFFEKLVIAERVAQISDEIFGNYENYSGLYILIGMVAFTLQLYTDFIGCMDIVIGIAEALGIKMPENFKRPFMSRTIQEFWQRWHITLGTWLKNYLFYPLLRTDAFMKLPKVLKDKVGKKAAKKITTYLAMFILWTVIGTWHGGAWHYVIGVGILQWAFIIIEELLEPVGNKVIAKLGMKKDTAFIIALDRIRVFVLMTIAFALFRATTIVDMLKMTGRIFTSEGWKPVISEGLFVGMEWYEWILLIVSLVIFILVQNIAEKNDSKTVRELIALKALPIRWGIWIALFMWVVLLGWYGPGFSAAEFIYQGF